MQQASKRDIRTLLEIMAILRDPVRGCPWDREQDFGSIAPYTIEEAYEVADAIDRDDLPADLRLALLAILSDSLRTLTGERNWLPRARLETALRDAEEKLPGYAAFNSARTARLEESQRLRTELADRRKEVVGRFPQYVSLTEPSPLSIAETQGLLGHDEALVAMREAVRAALGRADIR